jgi:hypothetical protein
VWEYRGDGLALGYAWLHSTGWVFGVSYTVSDYASPAHQLRSRRREHQGLRAAVRRRWKLSAVRKGYLRDLTVGFARQHPAPVEE